MNVVSVLRIIILFTHFEEQVLAPKFKESGEESNRNLTVTKTR